MSAIHCVARLNQAAGRTLSDAEVTGIYERIHKAALAIKAGKTPPPAKPGTLTAQVDPVINQVAKQAAADLMAEAAHAQRNQQLQMVAMSARAREFGDIKGAGLAPLKAVESLIFRDYSGRLNVQSLEQRVAGWQSELNRAFQVDLQKALGNDWLGFFQSPEKLLSLVRELRGEATGDALAAKAAKAFHDAAERGRVAFNESGGQVGKLDDWGMPQHHSQERVSAAGRDAWIDKILPLLDRSRYADDLGVPFTDAHLRDFLGNAWDSIAMDGLNKRTPGQFKGTGARANRHAEERQIHFKDAESTIAYWRDFGEKTPIEIMMGHMDTIAKDVAMVEHFGPNPDLTYRTLRDTALIESAKADPTKTKRLEGEAANLDRDVAYVMGQTGTTLRPWLQKVSDGLLHLNTAGKLGGAFWASFFGDKPMMEAIGHLNNLPIIQRWREEAALLNPKNAADRAMLQSQGLMLEMIRSGLGKFGDELGASSLTGKMANAVMRATFMTHINGIRKGAFGASLFNAIGREIEAGRGFKDLADSDVRTLRTWGITEADWNIWKLAKLRDIGHGADKALTPDAIAAIPDADLAAAGVTAQDRQNAVIKLLGAVNTESDFAVVTPGWRERAQFYAGQASQRGSVPGEILRHVLQFKSFPWAFIRRGMDAVANADTPGGKAAMAAWLVTSTTLAGAMVMQTRDMLAGKDPRQMNDPKFVAAAFLQGGSLGIYGDFIYAATHTRYGSGVLEALAGPTVGPTLEMALVQPLGALGAAMEGKDYHFMAKQFQDAKGFIPGGNIWYAKAAFDHLITQQIMEGLSPGYLSSIRQRTAKEFGQDWWWAPGEVTPERAPDLGATWR